ncbi:MAG: ornithine cyclodeaminase family protein [Acidobacteriaceae bacterium]|nr:ornithine cyclodeaminase family protein [Acidobacteriaceae bacterium]
MRDLIPCMRKALIEFSSGRVRQPVRTVIEVDSAPSFFGTMPAYAPDSSALGAKLVTVFPANVAQGLPSHLATIVLLDAATGALLAVMDGRFITEARTAAVSAVALDVLAPKSCPVLAIIGSGVQARSHLEALPLVRSFAEIRCWSPTPANVQSLTAAFDHLRVVAAQSAEAAARGANAIVLVTSSLVPVIESAWVEECACVISVGACRPNHREMDPALVARARVYVDSRASALRESGDILMGMAEGRFTESHIVAELGEMAANPPGPGEHVTVFKSMRVAVEDVAAAQLVYQRAVTAGKGLALA